MSGSKSSGIINAPRQHFESCKPIAMIWPRPITALDHALISGWEMTLQQARPGPLIAIQWCGQSSIANESGNSSATLSTFQNVRMSAPSAVQFQGGRLHGNTKPAYLFMACEGAQSEVLRQMWLQISIISQSQVQSQKHSLPWFLWALLHEVHTSTGTLASMNLGSGSSGIWKTPRNK